MSHYDPESSSSESTRWAEYSENKPTRVASKQTASAYMSVMRHCLGSDMALPPGYAGSESMEVHEAAAYVRNHIAKTKRRYVNHFTFEQNAALDKHYEASCKETEQMMKENGL